jgi:hypothetical protein
VLDIRKTGSPSVAAALLRDVPVGVLPYAAATALTRTARDGQKAIVDDMPRVFDKPTRYTLNATRLVPATKDNLVATVAVKDQGSGNGTRPESYLLPEVEGGKRNEKRFERALRYAGVLTRGQYVLPAGGLKLDAAGNVSAATSREVIAALKGTKAASATRDYATGKRLKKGRTLNNDLFIGQPKNGWGKAAPLRAGSPEGVYRREGRRLRLLFLITSQAPTYRRRLDFDGTVATVVRERFAAEFERAATDILNRRRRS